jgi:hypothetical protein
MWFTLSIKPYTHCDKTTFQGCEISSSNSGVAEDSSLLTYDTLSLSEWLPIF